MYMAKGGATTASLYDMSRAGNVYCAFFSGASALPAYSATALGPILYNGSIGSPQLKVTIIGVSAVVTTASAAAVSVGLAWGQSIPIAKTTAATLVTSSYANGKQPASNAYLAGTVSAAALGYLPLMTLGTAAVTAQPLENMWVVLDGGLVLPQGSFCAVAAGATATSSALDIGLMWLEEAE